MKEQITSSAKVCVLSVCHIYPLGLMTVLPLNTLLLLTSLLIKTCLEMSVGVLRILPLLTLFPFHELCCIYIHTFGAVNGHRDFATHMLASAKKGF